MGIEHVLNLVGIVLYLAAAAAIWQSGRRISAIVIIAATIVSGAFAWTASFYPVEYSAESGFPSWFKAMGILSVIGFVATASVLLNIARQLAPSRP